MREAAAVAVEAQTAAVRLRAENEVDAVPQLMQDSPLPARFSKKAMKLRLVAAAVVQDVAQVAAEWVLARAAIDPAVVPAS